MPRVLYRGKKYVTGQEAELAPESVGNLWRTEKSLVPAGRLTHKIVTALSHRRSSDPSNTFADFCTRLKGANLQNNSNFHSLFSYSVYIHNARERNSRFSNDVFFCQVRLMIAANDKASCCDTMTELYESIFR